MARVNYGNALYDRGDLYQAYEQFEAALRIDADCAQAHQGLAYVLEKLGDAQRARHHRELGYRGNAMTIVPYRGTQRAIPVLLLVCALGGNVNTERFLDDRTYYTTKLFPEYFTDAMLPYHEFAFNAIGDAELCPQALEAAGALLQRTNAPVINRPQAVAATSRANNAARLGGIDGVIAPVSRDFSRAQLTSPDARDRLAQSGLQFPLLVRTPGFHTGVHFCRIDDPAELSAAIEELPGERLTAIAFLDARGQDGLVRKYRVMIVDGALYPLHLAIATDWKVHYFTAEMAEHPQRRAEEAAFLNDMPGVLGSRAIEALRAIASTLELEYAGVDFGLAGDGSLLLFEANAPMLVPPLEGDPIFEYRGPAVRRIFDAVAAMLAARALPSIVNGRRPPTPE